MWQGLADECGGEEEQDPGEDNEGKRLKAALVVVLPSELMSVSKPKQVGANFLDDMAAEAATVTSRLRRKAPVSYGKERLALAWQASTSFKSFTDWPFSVILFAPVTGTYMVALHPTGTIISSENLPFSFFQ